MEHGDTEFPVAAHDGQRVLLADDNADMRLYVRGLLQNRWPEYRNRNRRSWWVVGDPCRYRAA
jgi:hypothetical protein